MDKPAGFGRLFRGRTGLPDTVRNGVVPMIAPPHNKHPGFAAKNRGFKSDPALIEACLAGNESAWNELVERYTNLVYSVPRRLGMNEADAADIVQNVFIILFRRLQTLRDDQLLARVERKRRSGNSSSLKK